MTTQPASTQLSVVPDAQKIEYIIDAPRKLAEMIENFQKEIVADEAAFYDSLAKDLAAASLSMGAIDKYQTFQAKKKGLLAKIEAAKELQPFLKRLIDEVKVRQPDALKTFIHNELARLQEEAEVKKDQAELIEDQIESLTTLRDELEKPASAAAAKSKKK
jgi:hypothetical protein